MIVPALVTTPISDLVPEPVSDSTPLVATVSVPLSVPPDQLICPLLVNAGEMVTVPLVMLSVSPADGMAAGDQLAAVWKLPEPPVQVSVAALAT